MHEHFIYHYEVYEVITIIIRLLTVWTIWCMERERCVVFVLRKFVCTSRVCVCVWGILVLGKHVVAKEEKRHLNQRQTREVGREKSKAQTVLAWIFKWFSFFFEQMLHFSLFFQLSFYLSCTLLTPTNERIFFVFDSLVRLLSASILLIFCFCIRSVAMIATF